tara:strand:+ start:500 stop:703 length:204 start_codon:yes stop_codon:yes gene_type:complete
MNERYYTLIKREGDHWYSGPGNSNPGIADDYMEYARHEMRACDLRIICTDDSRAAIEAEVDRLNRGE